MRVLRSQCQSYDHCSRIPGTFSGARSRKELFTGAPLAHHYTPAQKTSRRDLRVGFKPNSLRVPVGLRQRDAIFEPRDPRRRFTGHATLQSYLVPVTRFRPRRRLYLRPRASPCPHTHAIFYYYYRERSRRNQHCH